MGKLSFEGLGSWFKGSRVRGSVLRMYGIGSERVENETYCNEQESGVSERRYCFRQRHRPMCFTHRLTSCPSHLQERKRDVLVTHMTPADT